MMNLAMITCHFNPGAFQQSRRNYLRFLRQMESERVPVYVAELTYDYDDWVVPEAPSVLRLRTDRRNLMWHKENLLNLVEEIVPAEFDAIAWVDADIWFERLDWYEAICEALESHCVVQLFDTVVKTGPDGRAGSAMAGVAARKELAPGTASPGYGWAARRTLWTESGGLHDRAIIGGGDVVNASAWIPCNSGSFRWLNYPKLEIALKRQRRWFKENGASYGHVPGTIWHEWHGDFHNRRYVNRHKLVSGLHLGNDIVTREDGLHEFAEDVPERVRAGFAGYFAGRREDGRGAGRAAPTVRLGSRTDLINAIAVRIGAQRYLEIGLRDASHNFDHIRVPQKESVDPDPKAGADFVGTSDAFFGQLDAGREWDLIFIDGLHLADQVYRDIYHSLIHLSPDGYLVIHDCNPVNEWRTRSFADLLKDGGPWNGTVYKAIMAIRALDPQVEVHVVDMDEGCGVLRRRRRPEVIPPVPEDVFRNISYDDLARDRRNAIGLISKDDFTHRYLGRGASPGDKASAEQRPALGASTEPRVTALLLNWKRPANLPRVIDSIRRQTVPISIWLWDNSGGDDDFGVDVVIRASENFLCWPRWLMGALAHGDYVFSLDDDLMFTDDELIEKCIRRMEQLGDEAPRTVLGRGGVVLNAQKHYSSSKHVEASESGDLAADLLKGQFLFFSRALLQAMPLKRENEDDIKVSAAAAQCIIPSFMRGGFANLPSHDGLWQQLGHFERRNAAVSRYFDLQEPSAVAGVDVEAPVEGEGKCASDQLKVWVYWEDVCNSPGYMGKLFECMQRHLGHRLVIVNERSVYDYLPVEDIERKWGFAMPHWSERDWVVHKAEHIRLALVLYHGGIWIDADSIIFDDFDSWFRKIEEVGLVIRSEQLFGALPRHPFLRECLEKHRERPRGTWGNPGDFKRFLGSDFPHEFYRLPASEHESRMGPDWRRHCAGKTTPVSQVLHEGQKYLTINTQQFDPGLKHLSEEELIASNSLLARLIAHALGYVEEPGLSSMGRDTSPSYRHPEKV